MKINIEIENLAEFNFFYNTLMLGVLTAIQHNKISPQDGEQQIFSHMSIDRLKHSPFHPSFSDLVWKGSEIEDFDKRIKKVIRFSARAFVVPRLLNYQATLNVIATSNLVGAPA